MPSDKTGNARRVFVLNFGEPMLFCVALRGGNRGELLHGKRTVCFSRPVLPE